MTTPTLPAELLPWADALGVFEVDLAIGLGPVVRALDSLIGARTPVPSTHGERDGWAGLSRRGDPDRLLVSEWLLASELPDEFLRRAVSAELLHLDPAFHDDTPIGRLVCLVDVGPDQLGAGRLVQLAALIVLVRRAVALGTELRVGVAAGPSVSWLEGPFDVVAKRWLRARSAQAPDPAVVRGELDALAADDGRGRPDEVWLLCGPELAAHVRGRPRTLISEPGDWDDDGLRSVRVQVEHRVLTLPLPPAAVSVRALRGTGFATEPGAVVPTRAQPSGATGLRWPVFPGSGRRLVGRGDDANTLVSLHVDPQRRNRVKRHGFGAPVVAAAAAGHRLIVLLDRGEEVEIQVVGRPLEGLHGLRTVNPFVSGVGTDGPLDPLYLVDRTLLWHHGGRWTTIDADATLPVAVAAVGWTTEDSTPRVVSRSAWPADIPAAARDAAGLLLGPRRNAAWTHDGTTWSVIRPVGGEIVLDDGEQVLGFTQVGGSSGLVTESASGQVVRFRGVDTVRTFTRLSGAGAATHRALHPLRPWLVVAREQGTYVMDLDADEIVLRVPV